MFPKIRVIDHENNHVGVIPLHQALTLARDSNLDLILVNPDEANPTAKISDYHKMLYNESKHQKHQKKILTKEIRLHPNTGINDYTRALNHAGEFLNEGHNVVVSIPIKGREMAQDKRLLFAEFAKKVIADLQYNPDEHKIDQSFKKMSFTLKPKKTL